MDKIKVLHITTIDVGGAYKAVERIVNATSSYENIESDILLRNKVDPNNKGEVFLDSGFKSLVSKTKNVINGILYHKNDVSEDRFGSDISKHKLVKEADILVIHWINSFLSMRSIAHLLRLNKSVVIMLHDMWHITGGCSYSGECEGFLADCDNCVKTGANSHISQKAILSKVRNFSGKQLTVIAPGKWICECAKNGSVFKNHQIRIIPNCINTDVYSCVNKETALKKLDLCTSNPIVLFTAMTAGKYNERKGFTFLKKALEYFEDNSLSLIIIGNVDEESISDIRHEKLCLGYVKDENVLAMAYSVADVTVVPSLQETFCYTACESLACSTPVAAFNVGGLDDQIFHLQNGYLAKKKDSEDLANGIRYCIDNSAKLGKKARETASSFSLSVIGEKWKQLYEELSE